MGRDRRGWLRPALSMKHLLHQYLIPVLLLASCCHWDALTAGGTSIIALTVPQKDPIGSEDTSGSEQGFFPLSKAMASVMQLAVDDVNAAGGATLMPEGNLTLSVFGAKTGTKAMEGLCEVLRMAGEKGIFGIVGPMLSSQASLLEIMTNDFFGLPVVSPAASATRAATFFASGAQGFGAGPSFLFGTQPDVFEQMGALAKLILDMKTEREYARHWYQTTERVAVIYSDDLYGPIAASAFVRAAQTTTGINADHSAGRNVPSTIDIVSSNSVKTAAGTDYAPVLQSLVDKEASIIVLLAEGFDGMFIRSVLKQARDMDLVNKNIQWYLNGESAKDGIFTVNETYHDSQLAADLKGTIGVRACPPIEGPGSDEILALTSRWESLDSDVYPGAGPGTLTPDGHLDPLLGYAYDAVHTLARGIVAEQAIAKSWGSSLRGFGPGRCPFRTEGLWEEGEFIRSSALERDFVGVTGNVKFIGGDRLVKNGAGTAGSGWRDVNQTTFCGFNLQAHESLGGTFATTWAWRPEQRSDITGEAGFELIHPHGVNQTFPAGGAAYPFDRPTIHGTHFEVVTEEAAVPFTIVGREANNSDIKGISMDLMEELSIQLGFNYSITVMNSSVSTDEVVASVAEGRFDMVASRITINTPQMESVSFSYPYYSAGLTFVYREDERKVSWGHMFKPFEPSAWMGVFIATFVVFVLLWVFDGAKNGRFRGKKNPNPGVGRQRLKGMGISAYATGAVLMGQMAHEPYTLESHVLTSGWMFASFVLAAAFTAELAAFHSKERSSDRPFAVEDLRMGAVPHSQVAVWQNASYQTFYEEEIMNCFEKQGCYVGPVDMIPVLCHSLDECFDLVANGTCTATVVDSVSGTYRVAQQDFCDLHILRDTFKVEQYGLVLKKDSPFIGDFRQALLSLGETGTMKEIEDRYLVSSPCLALKSDEVVSLASSQNLTLIEMRGVFLVYGMFVVAALVAWLFQRVPTAKRQFQRQSMLQKEWRRVKKVKSKAHDSYRLRRNSDLLDEVQGGTILHGNTE